MRCKFQTALRYVDPNYTKPCIGLSEVVIKPPDESHQSHKVVFLHAVAAAHYLLSNKQQIGSGYI